MSVNNTAPLRMCVACRSRRPQGFLLRVVRTAEGTVCPDRGRHRAAGRGAYICAESRCIDQAERRQVFKRILGGHPAAQLYDALREAARARAAHVDDEADPPAPSCCEGGM